MSLPIQQRNRENQKRSKSKRAEISRAQGPEAEITIKRIRVTHSTRGQRKGRQVSNQTDDDFCEDSRQSGNWTLAAELLIKGQVNAGETSQDH